jgi:voltage-gated potassium channel
MTKDRRASGAAAPARDLSPRGTRAAAFATFSRAVDGPMLVLSALMLPILIVPLAVRLRGSLAAAFDAAGYLIWAAFVAEYLAKFALAPDRRRFVRTHVVDLVIIAVPFLRPVRALRALRLLRLAWLGSWAANAIRAVSQVLRHRKFHYALLSVAVLVFAGAAAELALEQHAPGTSIHTYGDALWWAMVTITTVGYGDKVPVTGAGQAVAVVFMIAGLALFGLLTATITSYFAEAGKDGLGARIEDLRQQVGRVEDMLAAVLAERGPAGNETDPAGQVLPARAERSGASASPPWPA